MDGLYFLLWVIGAGLIMFWVVQNDAVDDGEATRGLFAMR
jgi:hypothetical protein